MGTSWEPDRYLRYADERERPFWELLSRLHREPPRQVVDLGCGPGVSTAALVDRWLQPRVLGIDSSAQMIERALELAQPPRLAFQRQDIRDWKAPAASVDLILSNAALHWVRGHVELFPQWALALAPQGAIAFQVPRNFQAPSHLLLAKLAASPRWSDKLGGIAGAFEMPSPEQYYERLAGLGMQVDLWETTYVHVLAGRNPVLEWMRGTALRPYLDALGPAETKDFLASYAEELRKAYPPRTTGETLFPFRRLFVVAIRSPS